MITYALKPITRSIQIHTLVFSYKSGNKKNSISFRKFSHVLHQHRFLYFKSRYSSIWLKYVSYDVMFYDFDERLHWKQSSRHLWFYFYVTFSFKACVQLYNFVSFFVYVLCVFKQTKLYSVFSFRKIVTLILSHDFSTFP